MVQQLAGAVAAIVLVAAGPVVAVDAAEPPVPRNDAQLDGARPGTTPAERPLRPFADWLVVKGCKFPVDGSFIGRVQDGNISGMAAEGSNFSWPIAADGSFEGSIMLNANKDGDRIRQKVRGRIEHGRLVVDVEFDILGKPASVCRGVRQTLKLGG